MRPYRDGRIETRIEGPADPFGDGASLEVPLTLEPQGAAVVVQTGDWQQRLEAGDWSDWVRLEFDILGPLGVTGIVRFHLVQGYPDPVLYMSPIHIDPQDPAVPLTHPASYAGELADRIGLYHTIGMPEETWSLNEGHISGEAFLEMEKTILAEREAMFFDALERADSELVMGVFVQTDRISHMFYRGLDPDHPLYPETSEVERQAIDWIYREADRIVGKTLDAMGPDDRLIIISDHGFAPFRRAVHLNSWLRRAGFLVLKEGAKESGALFSDVDWSRTRAYAIGLNGVFLNLAGREAEGIVDPKDATGLKAELAARLAEFRDPDLDQPVISRVFDGAEIYPGNANDDAPDLVAGYHRGYRASWQTSLGAVPPRLIDDNDRAWSGDHCIDPALVPGVFFSSRPLDQTVSGIGDIAGLILSLQ